MLNLSARERILSRITHEDRGFATPCWTSNRSQNGDGYTKLTFDKKLRATHRFAYEVFVGPIPEGAVIDHLCRNRACCNPDHLEPVSPRENVLRGETIVAANARKTHCGRGHPLISGNLVPSNLRQGSRTCQTCATDRARTNYKKRKLGEQG